MNQVEIDGISRTLPSSWNELSRAQLLYVARLFQGQLSVVDFNVKALIEFLSINRKLLKRIHPEDAHSLCETLDFLIKDVTLTRNVIPVIRTGFRKFYGPSDSMLHCTFGEFTMASSILDEYNITRDPLKLDELVAILYRRRKLFWFIRRRFTDSPDPRQRFRERTMKHRVMNLAKVDFAVKYSVFLFFTGVLNSLSGLYPYVYQQKEESENPENGWASLIISLADGKTDDKSLETIMNSNLYNVFIGMNKKAKEYHEYLAKIDHHGYH